MHGVPARVERSRVDEHVDEQGDAQHEQRGRHGGDEPHSPAEHGVVLHNNGSRDAEEKEEEEGS